MLVLACSLLACNSDAAPDCFQTAGEQIRKEIVVTDFTKITVFDNVRLVLRQGDTQKVEIETGENLLNEVSAIVTEDRLRLMNTNDCNFFRAYGLTTVYVTSPNINEIRSSTGLTIKSDGILAYPNLTLFSESFLDTESETTDAEFDIEIDSERLSVIVNGITYFKLKGKTTNFSFNIAAGDSRIEAEDLIAETVNLNHRGSNDAFVNPQAEILGEIRGTGNVISSTRPTVVAVDQLYKGRLIFKN